MFTRSLTAALAAAALCACEVPTDTDDDAGGGGNEPTTGQIVFWTATTGLTPISVQIGGVNTQVTSTTASAPSCGQSGSATVTLAPGSYNYTASSPAGVTWNSSQTISAGGCMRLRLDGTVPPTQPPTQPPTGSFTTPETYFADMTGTLSVNGSSVEAMSVTANTTFVLRFVSQYGAQAAIIPAAQVNAFRAGQAFTGYAIFDRVFGTKTVTVPPGQYYLAVRNTENGSNQFRAELDRDIQLPAQSGYTFSYVDSPLSGNRYVSANGGRMWHGFTIQSGYRYLLDGASVGMGIYIIPASELGDFQAGREFQYYEDYGGNDGAYPGLWELRLPAGSYYLVAHNPGSVQNPIAYLMERWRIN